MSSSPFEVTIHDDPRSARALWNGLAEDSLAGAAQSAHWFDLWQSLVNRDCLVAALSAAGAPIFLLPLEIRQEGPIRVATFVGGPHANCNFPVLARSHSITRSDLALLFRRLRKARPDIDLVSLTRQLGELGGAANPLLQFSSRENPNVSLALALDRDFDAVLARTNSKRKKKKHRYSAHRFQQGGGYRIVLAGTPAETDAMLETYFECKAERLAKAGIRNTYEPAGIQDFFRQLFAGAAAAASPAYQLKALEVDGKYRAVLGKSRAADQTFIDFVGITQDDLASTSPGEFLFFEDIQESCRSGPAVYSFGIGDEPYKRSWCDIELTTYDTAIGFSIKGRIYGVWLTMRNALVRAIKRNDLVWTKVKKLRARLRGTR
ncbi:MAG: GNAT family N-acetyltransferase [Phyllobacterium sp.]